MLLTRNNVVQYLMERRLLETGPIVDGDVMVIEAPRRNSNFKVTRRGGPGFFIKQVRSWDERDQLALQREATCYWLAAADPRFSTLTALMPRYHGYDRERAILITELLGSTENVSEYHLRRGEFPSRIGAAIGEALGGYHRGVRDVGLNPQHTAAFAREIPWILSAHQLLNYVSAVPGDAGAQLGGILARHTGFHHQLDALRARWNGNSLVHGDIKWDNLIVREERGGVTISIIDWELADFGDPCWDAGAVFQSYFAFWILAIPVSGPATPEQLVASAPYPIEGMQPSMRAFWSAYVHALGAAERSDELLERSLGYAAARMIQTAYEYVVHFGRLTPSVVLMLQVSLNVLNNPRHAIEQLVGIVREESGGAEGNVRAAAAE